MVRSRSVDYQRVRKLTPRSADEFTRTTPIQAHTPLSGIHGFRNTGAQVCKVPPERERCLPIDGSRTGLFPVRNGVGDDMGGSKDGPRRIGRQSGRLNGRSREDMVTQLARTVRKPDFNGHTSGSPSFIRFRTLEPRDRRRPKSPVQSCTEADLLQERL